MTDTSSNLKLPFILPSQAQKHVTHNEALQILDALVQLTAISSSRSVPPASAQEADIYIIANSATGVWSGHEHDIAVYRAKSWQFYPPRVGWRAYIPAQNMQIVYTGKNWILDEPTKLQNLTLFGLNAKATAAVPVHVRANTAVWSAKSSGDGGTGSMVQVLERESIKDDLGFMLKTDGICTAVLGQFGSNRFRVSVSVDGKSFLEALSVNTSKGIVDFEALPRFKSTINYDQYIALDVWKKVSMNSGEYNAQNAFDASKNVFKAPVAGTYLMGACYVYKRNSSDDAKLQGRLVKNGNSEVSGSFGELSGLHRSEASSLNLQAMVALAANDTIECQARFRQADGYIMADKSAFWGCKIG